MSGVKSVTFTAPPNLRSVNCCDTCKHVEHGYEGEVTCTKHPAWVNSEGSSYTPIHDGISSSHICDDFEPEDTPS